MSKVPSLYDLYGATSLLNLERSIAEGKTPTGPEIAAILEANSDGPLPPWFIEIVTKSLRGEIKKRAGRPKESWLSEIRFAIARLEVPACIWHGCKNGSFRPAWSAGLRFAEKTGGLGRPMNARWSAPPDTPGTPGSPSGGCTPGWPRRRSRRSAFDLVSAQYPALLRTPDAAAERALLAAVAPGGVLLLVHHAGMDTQQAHDSGFDPADYVWPAMVAALLDDGWQVEVDEQRPRIVPTVGAGAHHVDDLVLRARRLR